MGKDHTAEELRMKAHSINCELYEEGLSPRDIEIIGYYLNRIAASYLSYFTHKDYEKTIKEDAMDVAREQYTHL
ncbi:MAG: hypothetical protein NT038_05725 [Euryarchaeota archaeon]|nr:hypothetical protein [Euryarchaeota archaeon]